MKKAVLYNHAWSDGIHQIIDGADGMIMENSDEPAACGQAFDRLWNAGRRLILH
jgi:hypothetical protein